MLLARVCPPSPTPARAGLLVVVVVVVVVVEARVTWVVVASGSKASRHPSSSSLVAW